jgi:glyoxylase-like metal-dependent hydrolase (beta-lactamase superfamily II)
MRLGNITLEFASDGTFYDDGGGFFGLVPKVLWEQVVEPDELNRIPFEMRSLLIKTSNQYILIDTGYGDKLSDKQRGYLGVTGDRRLLHSLEELGLEAADIDLVINTHLHGDHCGGNTRHNDQGKLVPTFPNATYYVQRLELADAMYPNERTRATYSRDNIEPLAESGQLEVLTGDTRLTDEVRVIITPGHTRAHQSVVIESCGDTAIYLGDVASWPTHMERLAWVAAYDVEPLITIETKRSLARWAAESQALLIFEHHPGIAAGYLYATDRPDRFRLEPVDTGS